MLFAQLDGSLGLLNVVSYHAPPGVTWGYKKVEHAHALLDWINQSEGPVLIGADANTPEVDHPEPDKVRTHWHTGSSTLRGRTGDDVTFGGRPHHRLHDAYRRWLNDDPARMQAVALERPSGPLAVSHHTGRRRSGPGVPRRYDSLWISPEIAISNITYNYENAIAAGTDHALLTAELSITAS